MLSISHEKLTLSNGLEVILHEDHSLPNVAVNVWYHVGSKDEDIGRTGFAHLFEHVMFEGSKHHNRDYFEPLQKVGGSINGSTTRTGQTIGRTFLPPISSSRFGWRRTGWAFSGRAGPETPRYST